MKNNKTKQMYELEMLIRCTKKLPQEEEFIVDSFLDTKTGEEYKFKTIKESFKTGVKYKEIPFKRGADQTVNYGSENKIVRRYWKKQEQ